MYSVDTINQQITQLTEDEQRRLFILVKNNAELFNKVMPNMPLVQLILSGGLNDIQHPIVDIYNKVTGV